MGHRRDTSRYACGNPASTRFSRHSLFSARPSHQKAGHRAIAQVVPRAGVVNARRPGRRPGRSEAKSIDEAEHGASLKCAMVASGIWIRKRWRSFRETLGRARAHFLCDSSAASSLRIWTRTRARAQRVYRARPVRADSDIGHDQRWRERPRLDGLGSLARQDSGVVHAIVGSPTAIPAPTVTAAKSAASIAPPRKGAAIQTLARANAHGATRGKETSGEGGDTGGLT